MMMMISFLLNVLSFGEKEKIKFKYRERKKKSEEER